MPTTLQQIESGALDALASVIQTNSGTIEPLIATGEADLTGAIANLIKNIPSIKGAIGLIGNPIEAEVEAGLQAYVAGLIAKLTPAEVVSFFVSLLQGEATRIGGTVTTASVAAPAHAS